ncbi:cytochrome o ubiquinol oxidase subunit IV [Mangrovicoccus algicola]|uniref:Cytochrome bo(3) ubiquinol oxidase subunit 4 n=1 Tax=Mangrovicoccus algicola TaxID=2771008 RepID=A0A8J6YVR6_9RHOB|nr:cytochrome o ubiquinol oxidase subunit IV [Mangrovicoccus algicola]MBE3638527.1 cytochrome o ubiquinol oxidase subunit IV [Mangrovicoccus algicola]
MSEHPEHGQGHVDHGHGDHGTFGSLMTGFGLAGILTLIPFGIVMMEPDWQPVVSIGIIMGLGAIQIVVHLVYFLHLNRDSEEGWTFAATIFAIVILAIVLAGSLWVMHNMNANMMPMSEENMTGLPDLPAGAEHGGHGASHE